MAAMAGASMEGERAAKKHKVAAEGSADQPLDLSDDNATVFRFSVYDISEWMEDEEQWLQRDDVVISVTSSLYDLLVAVFKERMVFAGLFDHLFEATLAGKKYDGPFEGLGGFFGKPCNTLEPVALDTLSLQAGVAKGSYSMESASFKFKLLTISPAQPGRTYPCVEAAAAVAAASSAEAADHLTPAEIAAAEQFRADFEVAAAGDNTWTRVRPPGGFSTYVASKYKAPGWNDHYGRSGHHLFKASNCMGLLIKAEWSFAKAWKYVLQYALLDRTKGASATRYSTMKKQWYEVEHTGARMSKEQRIIAAKQLGKSIMRSVMEIGVPKLGPKPMTEAEVERREAERLQQGLLDDEDSDDEGYYW